MPGQYKCEGWLRADGTSSTAATVFTESRSVHAHRGALGSLRHVRHARLKRRVGVDLCLMRIEADK